MLYMHIFAYHTQVNTHRPTMSYQCSCSQHIQSMTPNERNPWPNIIMQCITEQRCTLSCLISPIHYWTKGPFPTPLLYLKALVENRNVKEITICTQKTKLCIWNFAILKFCHYLKILKCSVLFVILDIRINLKFK